jgi:type I restriction enzyme M protein
MGYIPTPSKEVQIDKGSASKKRLFLRPFDVLLIYKGSVGKVGITPESVPEPGEGGWIAGQSAVVLRVNNPYQVNPKALAVYLRSDLGQKLLESISVQGATIPMIQLRELQKLPVIIPPTEDAAEIGKILDDQSKIQCEIEQLRAKQIELARSIWTLE